MALALIIMLWTGLVGLLLNVLIARVPALSTWVQELWGIEFIAQHFILGTAASLWALFAVVLTMFYFIGTAKAVKEGVREHDLDRGYYQLTLKYKRVYFPGLTLSLLFYVGAPSLGAGTHGGAVPAWIHEWTAYATLLVHVWVTLRGQQYLLENDRLVAKVDYLMRKGTEEDSSASDCD